MILLEEDLCMDPGLLGKKTLTVNCPKRKSTWPGQLDGTFLWPCLHIPSIDKWYPFHIPSLELCISFKCCKCTVFKVWIKHKTRMFSRLFHTHKMHLLALLGLFYDQNIKSPYPFIYLHKWDPYHFIYLRTEKVPLSGGASPYKPLYGVPASWGV